MVPPPAAVDWPRVSLLAQELHLLYGRRDLLLRGRHGRRRGLVAVLRLFELGLLSVFLV